MIEVGQEMCWHRTVSNSFRRVRVKKVGEWITVDSLDGEGNVTRTTRVRPEHLHPLKPEN